MAYQLLEEIGRGGMGCVYQGRDSAGQIVAIKMMSNQVTCYPEYRALFNSEVDTLKRMKHPSVVHIVGEPFDDEKGNLYLPMEFIRGETIEQYVKNKGTFSVSEAVQVMIKILDAIQYVHDQNCIHRDIKPSNIMLRADKSVCIIDFGIAKDAEIGSTGKTIGRIIGTDGYMSPEQAKGLHIDKRTDIYSIGCVFYFMLTGKHAIAKSEHDYKTVQAIINDTIPSLSLSVPDISPDINNAFLKSVHKNMTLRFQTAGDFKKALLGNSGRSNSNGRIVTVGKAADNDIRFSNEYVSGHHLIIKGYTTVYTGGDCDKHYIVEIEDISTNGTGIDGKRVHHSAVRIDCTATHMDPTIMLAGRPECLLDWQEVLQRLGEPSLPVKEGLSFFLGIVSFLFPIVGWILWGIWKNENPTKSSQVAKWAWAGFVFNLIISLISIYS